MRMQARPRFDKSATVLPAAALAALLAALMVLAAVPPVDRDGLTHHLAVPKLYLKHGGMVELPAVPFSYYPMNIDMLYLVPLYFGNDILPKFIHLVFALLTGLSIFRYLRETIEAKFYAFLGALMFLSLPVIIKLSITAYVDLGLIFFSTASMLRLFRWARTGCGWRDLLAAGALAGLCLGTKPNGLLAVFGLTLTIPFLHRRHGGDAAAGPDPGLGKPAVRAATAASVKWVLVFGAIALVLYAPWMIRNIIWKGNPVYPLASRIFESKGPDGSTTDHSRDAIGSKSTEEKQPAGQAGFGHFSIRRFVFGESLSEILLIPIRIFFQGRDDDPRLFDGRLNPYLLIFPLSAFWAVRPRQRPARLRVEMNLMGSFSVLYLAFAFFLTDMRIRYISPILPFLVILSVIGISDLFGLIRGVGPPKLRRWTRCGLGAVLVGLLSLNASYLTEQFAIVDPLGYLGGKLTREEYIQRYRPEYAAISYANRTLPADARILALFHGNRIYYSDREMISGIGFFAEWVDAAESPEDFRERLTRAGISHLLIGTQGFSHWANGRFDPRRIGLLNSVFQSQVQEVFHRDGYVLYRVL